jgi:ribosomal-protein-alanine N-acetyltransferase
MTEACEAVTDFWFNTLKFPVLRAPKAVGNTASRRISERSGMRLIATEEQEFVSGRLPAEIWEITAEEWNARHRSKQGSKSNEGSAADLSEMLRQDHPNTLSCRND